jgi:hypothetical protein
MVDGVWGVGVRVIYKIRSLQQPSSFDSLGEGMDRISDFLRLSLNIARHEPHPYDL